MPPYAGLGLLAHQHHPYQVEIWSRNSERLICVGIGMMNEAQQSIAGTGVATPLQFRRRRSRYPVSLEKNEIGIPPFPPGDPLVGHMQISTLDGVLASRSEDEGRDKLRRNEEFMPLLHSQ